MASNDSNADVISDLIYHDFSEFGPISFINVIINKSIAFVRYLHRSSAEFAKEAMHRQCLRKDRTETVLAVRWANEDPNPTAKARVKREREERFVRRVAGEIMGAQEGSESEESDDWRRYVSDEDDKGEDEDQNVASDDPRDQDDVNNAGECDHGKLKDGSEHEREEGVQAREGANRAKEKGASAAKAGPNHPKPTSLFAAYASDSE